MVRFRTGDNEYAVFISHTREVRSAAGIVPMPSAIEGVVGLLARDDEALTVTNLLGAGGNHVLVLDPGDGPFGLLVDEVLGVFVVDLNSIGPPPTGQQGNLVSGSLLGPEGLVLVLDADAIARVLVG
jgi:chemotaxis signal transduction protein